MKLFWILTSGSRRDVVWGYFLSTARTALLFSSAKPFYTIEVESNLRSISTKLFSVLTSGSEGDVISYLQLWWPFCSVEQNHLYNFDRGHYEKYFCEIVLNLDLWFRRCRLNVFLIYSSGGFFVQWSRIICAILVESIIRNISVILYLNQWWWRRCRLK